MKRKIARVCLVLMAMTLLLSSFTASAAVDKAYQTYTYSSMGTSQYSPDAYYPSARYITFGEVNGEEISLEAPKDLFVDEDGNTIIADTGHNRVVVLDQNFKAIDVIETFDSNKKDDTFAEPTGIYRHTDGRLFVCDKLNHRLVVFSQENGKFVFNKIINPPPAKSMYDGFIFSPKSVAIDATGRLNVVCEGETMGILTMAEDSEWDEPVENSSFEGYIGAIPVSPTAAEIFWRLFMTEEQIAADIKQISPPYNNVAVDDKGFIYATASWLETGEIYGMVQSKDTSSAKCPVKRYTPSGQDVLVRNGHFSPLGDLEFPITNNTTDTGASIIEDVAIGENDVYSLMDSQHNKIFTYDGEGNLLYAFGGKSTAMGNFTRLIAIDYKGKDIVALDEEGKSVTLFTMTDYGALIDEVITLQSQRKYTETIPIWEKIKEANNNFDLAYVGIGKSLLQQGKYDEAMEYFYAADVPDQYSLAMKGARSESLEQVAIFIPVVIILAVFLLAKLFAWAKKYNTKEALAGGPHSTKSGLIYGFHVIFRPFDGFWDLKHEKRGNMKSALILLGILLVSSVVSTPLTGYLFGTGNRLESTFFNDLFNVLLPLVLWCVANWCLTSLMDGKGSLKDIFISVCFAVIPLCFLMIPSAIVSNFLTLDEAAILSYMMNIAYVWTGILIVASSMTVHDYSFGKNILVCILTIVGMAIILFLAMLFLSVSNRIIEFIGNLISEISLRI